MSSAVLLVPALRADRYLKAADSVSRLVQGMRARLERDEGNGAPVRGGQPPDGTAADVIREVTALEDEMKDGAKAWSPWMSRLLRFGVFMLLISSALRFMALCSP